MQQYGRHVAFSLLWMFGQTAFARAASFFSQLALAALLSPGDFGAIGLTYSVTAMAAVFTNFGLDDVVIQRGHRVRYWTGPAFWMSLGAGAAIGAATALASPLAARVYHLPYLRSLICIVCLSMPIGAASTVPNLMLRERLSFRFLAVYNSIEVVLQALATVLLAYLRFGAYSFVIPVPVFALMRTIVLWSVLRGSVDLRLHIRRWKYLLRRTSRVFVNNVLLAMVAQGDYAVLGAIGSKEAVGAYYFGYRLAAQPLWTVAGNLSSVLFPVFVRLADNPARQRAAALDASSLLAYAVFAVAAIQASVARPLIVALFGAKWLAAIPVVQLLSIGLAIDAVSWISASVLKSRGHYATFLLGTAVTTPLFFVFVYGGARLNGTVGVASAVFLFYAVTQPFVVWLAYRMLGIRFSGVIAIYIRPLAYAAAAMGLAFLVSSLLGLGVSPWEEVGCDVTVVSCVYVLLLRVFSPAYWHASAARVRGMFGKVTGASVYDGPD